jgi:hypothetical protein
MGLNILGIESHSKVVRSVAKLVGISISSFFDDNPLTHNTDVCNAISLADEIEKVISTKNSLKLMGENAKKLAQKEFKRSDLSLGWVNWWLYGLKK